MKVILESIHFIFTLFNLLEKLLLKSRQCSIFSEVLSICHYVSKDIFFLVWTAEVFPYNSLIHLSRSWRARSLLLGPGAAVVDGETESPPSGAHIRRHERSEVIWTANKIYLFGRHFIFPKTSEMKMIAVTVRYIIYVYFRNRPLLNQVRLATVTVPHV